MSKDVIFVIPKEEGVPIKIIHESLPCPVLYNLGRIDYRCDNANSKMDDLNFVVYCSDVNNCNIKIGVYKNSEE